MGIWDRTKEAWAVLRGKSGNMDTVTPILPMNNRERYKLFSLIYENRVFKELALELPAHVRDENYSKIKTLENPAVQAVEFGTMHLFPGDLEEAIPLECEGPNAEAIVEAAYQILRWSNFGRKKRVYSEWQYLYGDAFLKPSRPTLVRGEDDYVYLQVRQPIDVTHFEEDAKGRVTYARLDVQLPKDPADKTNATPKWWTEEWDLARDRYRQWTHIHGPEASIAQLESNDPDDSYLLSERGISFIPLVRAPLRDNGNNRSPNIFDKWIEAIEELLREGTTLRNRWFRYGKNTMVFLRNEAGKGAIKVSERTDDRPSPRDKIAEEERIQAEQNDAIYMPGAADVKSLVPDIDWQAGLNQIIDSREALERVIPELKFFRGHDKGDPSAAAMRMHVAPAINRANEARGNAEAALIEALRQCLVIGVQAGIFQDFGEIEADDFKLRFAKRAIMPETPEEKAARQAQETTTLTDIKNLGIPELLEQALIERGWDDASAKKMAKEAINSKNKMAELLTRRPDPQEDATKPEDKKAEEEGDTDTP